MRARHGSLTHAIRLTLAVVSIYAPAVAHSQIAWQPNLSTARAAAKRQGKLILAVFIDASARSRQFVAATLRNPDIVQKTGADFVAVKFEADKDPTGPKKLGVRFYPTTVLLTSELEEAGRIEGFAWAGLFRDELAKILSSHRAWSEIQAQYSANPKGGEPNARMAWALAIRHRLPEAERHLASARRAGYRGPHLARALNMIGDLYQFDEDFKKAISYFRQADASTKDPIDRSYAKVSVLSCLLQSGDAEAARKAAQELIDLPGATPEYVELAKRVLKGPTRRRSAPKPPIPPGAGIR